MKKKLITFFLKHHTIALNNIFHFFTSAFSFCAGFSSKLAFDVKCKAENKTVDNSVIFNYIFFKNYFL